MSETSKKILLIEDEPIAQTLYQNRLQRDGFEIVLAEDGEVALTELSKMQPDLVVLDLMLPKVNGTEVLNRIRSDERLKKVPVLVISNAYMTELSKKALESGATRGMMKTECTPGRLVEAVRDLLGFKSAFDLTDTPVSDENQVEAFADAAERALADEITLKETREEFIEKAPIEAAKIREHSLAYIKAGATPASQKPLNSLYEEVRFFATRAGLSGCVKTARLADAFEALLFDIVYKPDKVTASTLQTVAQAVDCLERLCQKADASVAESNLHGKILIVDDDAVCNLAMVAALKRANLEAVGVQESAEALQFAQMDQFDIVYLDINMPGMNGFELCGKLRTMPEYKEAPIIFVTSHTDFENRKKGILSGGNDFIPKPISPVELTLKTTMRLLQPQGQWAETSAVASCLKTTLRLLQEEEAQAVAAQSAAPAATEKPAAQTDAPSKDFTESAPIPFTAPQPAAPETPPVATTADVAPPAMEKLQMAKPEEPAKPAAPVEKLEKPEKQLPDVNAVNIANKYKPTQTSQEPPKLEKLQMAGSSDTNAAPPAIEKIEMAKPAEPVKPVEPPKEEKLPDVNHVNLANKNEAPAPVEKAPEEKIEMAKPVEEEKLPHVNGVNGANGADKNIPPEIKIEPKVENIAPAETPPPAPRQITPQTDSIPNRNTTPKMENTIETKKPTIEEAARGIARIIFGDENITDMNVRLTRIALESYNVHGTKSLDEVARHVTKIIFGDQNVTDMNVRLTRIALERYNVTEVLGLSNGSNNGNGARMNLTSV